MEKIDPDLFARLMSLSATERADLLEYIGQAPVWPKDLAALVANGHDGKRADWTSADITNRLGR